MAKPPKSKNHPIKTWEKYDCSSGLKKKGSTCPKCGKGIFMAEHKNRSTCGKCGYTEFKSK